MIQSNQSLKLIHQCRQFPRLKEVKRVGRHAACRQNPKVWVFEMVDTRREWEIIFEAFTQAWMTKPEHLHERRSPQVCR
jgi:hypothetical protein